MTTIPKPPKWNVYEYCIRLYSEAHDISEEEASQILYGCNAMEGFGRDARVIGHMNNGKLIGMLRYVVEKNGGVNPPIHLPKKIGYYVVTEIPSY